MTEKASRQRLVAGAADLLSRRGVKATSIRELAKHAQAPLGSTYHYFPGGKAQLVTEAVRFIGGKVSEVLAKSLERGPVSGLQEFLALWRHEVVRSDYRAGCPVLSVAVEEPDDEESRAALTVAEAVFADWIGLLTRSLSEHGVDDEQARQLATLVVASVEGAIALCRARRSAEPLEQVSTQLEALIRQALGE
ncbi:TetR/AcrR family transcriptional regulator [Alloalcanivorax profundimaris]|uniref:TetR/AcrR family transcriptional regulator n=1 Tax=Alloalcanivorax profundimaris TaxID=2735259 RepID=UPI001E4BBB02|nr:TetR/AcrR family transcriptional regulator [Alloalcanivorax profundimaris]